MFLLPPYAICDICGWHYSIVCRFDDEKIYISEHVEQCGRANQLAMVAASKTVEPINGLESSTPSSSAK